MTVRILLVYLLGWRMQRRGWGTKGRGIVEMKQHGHLRGREAHMTAWWGTE